MQTKSKFLTFLFSLVPGAGQMYLGFMKQGVTFMFLFFFSIFLIDFLRLSLLFTILPVIWCYSLFDTWNKSGMPPEELAAMEDKSFLVTFLHRGFLPNHKIHVWFGAALIFLGLILVFDNIVLVELERMGIIYRYVMGNYLRTFFVSAAMIGFGIWFLIGKKQISRDGGESQ